MIVKKLHARFINDKILINAEHCYIATAGIAEEGFDFVMSRLPPKCKVTVVTGLDELTSPALLWKILKDYYGRVSLNLYTKNVFRANAYIFDLPYRKRLAFISSGAFTPGGLQHFEELSFRTDAEKEVEELKVWFNNYIDNATPLTEKIIREYELIYPALEERAHASQAEKAQFNSAVAAWDERGLHGFHGNDFI